ncbi:Crp/Fnr family transcriptional regulator [Streptomyces sp. LP05-1]|uniref:Crp/Fnr family transcriptional regulator n=1 Tax=Streptomyces pyxinae TaxID=2970734 RepID=A0ABT2CCP8_9ACTN|nr:Crp/Fnr family transcriptional regulator [Streptomyces sp. LP05-1]MCS0635151.1 Crp/Fnr family transcriptional regulator [Streptomyces sp. LP05-1]
MPARPALLAAGAERVFPPGSPLVVQGDTSTHLLLILDGLAKVTATTEEGHVTLLAFRTRGDVIGEQAAVDGSPRSATVTAVTEVRARIVTHDDFITLLGADPRLALALVAVVSRKLRNATAARVDTAGHSLATRLARALVALADTYGKTTDHGVEISIPLSQDDLSAIVSASRAAVTRALRMLREHGVIDTRYRHVTIIDLPALSLLAEG